ncbi:MAG: hypothetical protein D6754_14380 [Alphaproteobacteria bacterium]|nr:MAG: hypothetical protein D6754_14380 [Alphaproteobacteria bacterium]
MQRRHRYFAIIASMRTGSNLLQRILRQFPDLVCHGELFNPQFIGGKGQTSFKGIDLAARDRDPLALIERMITDAGPAIPGFRIFDGHDRRVLEHVATDPDCARILLTRDPLESFISLMIARRTDQWILTDPGKRREAKVFLDPDALAVYRRRLAAFRREVTDRARRAGLSWFPVDYAELGEREIVNGLAAHIGSEHRLDRIATDLLRQNPGPLAEKLENPEVLETIAPEAARPEPAPGVRPNVRRFVFQPARGLMFAPIPGGPSARINAWLDALASDPPETGLSRGRIDAAFRAGRIRCVFTATRHPFLRAFDVFARKLLAPEGDGFPRIRRMLAEQHGLHLPPAAGAGGEEALSAGGFGLERQREAFAGFLRFLRANIAGSTLIRIDPLWAPQSWHVAALAAEYPPGRILREADFPHWARGICPDVPAPSAEPGGSAAWAQRVWTPELARLCLQAYPMDHTRLGHAGDARPETGGG